MVERSMEDNALPQVDIKVDNQSADTLVKILLTQGAIDESYKQRGKIPIGPPTYKTLFDDKAFYATFDFSEVTPDWDKLNVVVNDRELKVSVPYHYNDCDVQCKSCERSEVFRDFLRTPRRIKIEDSVATRRDNILDVVCPFY